MGKKSIPTAEIRRRFMRILKWFGSGVLTLFLAVVLAVCAGTVWLRTESGTRFVAATAVEALHSAGIEARIGELQGPLPGTLRLADVTLADAKGPWLNLSGATLRLSLPELLRWRVVIRELTVQGLDVSRAPDLPPSPVPAREKKSDPLAFTRLPAWLPAIEIEKLSFSPVNLAPALLGLPADTAPVRLALNGEASTINGAVPGMRARLELAAAAGDAKPADLLRLEVSALQGAEHLALRLSFTEEKGGLLSRLAGLGDMLPLEVRLEGDAPAREWKGAFSAKAGDVLSVRGEAGAGMPAGGGGALSFDLSFLPGTRAPSALAAALGASAKFSFRGTVRPGEVCVPLLEVNAPAWLARAEGLCLKDMKDASSALAGNVSLRVEDPAALAAFAPLPFANGEARLELEGSLASLTAHFTAMLNEVLLTSGVSRPDVRAKADFSVREGRVFALRGEVSAKKLPFVPGGEDQLAFDAEAERENGGVALRQMRVVSSLGQAQAEGAWNPSSPFPGVRAKVKVELPRLKALCALFGVKGVSSGALSLGADFAPLEEAERAGAAQDAVRMGGAVDVKLKNASWTEELAALQKLVGGEAALSAKLEGLSPVSGGSNAVPWLEVKDLRLAAAGVSAEGQGRFTAGAKPAFETHASVTLKDLSALAADVSGEVLAKVAAHGPVSAPEGEFSLESQELVLKGEKFSRVALRVDAKADLSGASPKGNGSLNLNGASGKVLMRLGARFRLENGTASVASLDGNLLGVALAGELTAHLPDAGRATPRLDGTFSASVQDWAALSAFVGPAKAAKAEARFTLKSLQNGAQSVEAALGVANFSLGTEVSLAKLDAQAAVADLFGARRVSCRMTAGEGHAGGASGVAWRQAECEANLAPSAGSFMAKMRGDVDFEAAARLEGEKLTIATLRLKDAKRGLGAALAGPVTVLGVGGKALSVREATLRLMPRGEILLNGGGTGEKISARLAVKDVPLSMARPFLGMAVPDGNLNADFDVSGAASAPAAKFGLRMNGVKYPDSSASPVSCVVEGNLPAKGTLAVSLEATGFGGKGLRAAFRLPFAYGGAFPALSKNAPLSGSANFEGPLAPLWRFVPVADMRVSGYGRLDAELGGTLAALKPKASLKLEKAGVMDLKNGLEIVGVDTSLQLSPEGLATLSLSGLDGRGGKISLNGSANLAQSGLPLQFTGKLASFSPLHRRDVRVVLDGDVSVTGLAFAPDVVASITVPGGEVRLDGLSGGGFSTLDVEIMDGPDASAPEKTSAAARKVGSINAQIRVPGQFYVRGHGLESEWEGDLSIRGALNDPAVVGKLVCTRGVMSLFGKAFTLARGIVSFGGERPPAPMLDVSVQRKAGGYLTEALLSGSATKPRLTLSSQPPMPQDEVVSQMLFGRAPSELSRTEAIQLGAAVASLSGLGAGANLMDMTRDRLGVDVLRLGSARDRDSGAKSKGNPLAGPTSAASSEENVSSSVIEMGKYVRDDVYVGVQQGVGSDSTEVFVDIEMTPQINLEARTSGNASEVGVNWNWDY